MVQVYYFKAGEFRLKAAEKLFPGEIIKLEQGEEVPADCVVLKVTNQRNCCYVETTNLDNEDYLSKKVMPVYIEGKDESDPIEFLNLYVNNTVSCDSPNSDIYSFKGELSTVGNKIPLNIGTLQRKIRF